MSSSRPTATWSWWSATTASACGIVTRRSGLANLAERAEQLGGTLKVGAADGSGTELHWQVPLP